MEQLDTHEREKLVQEKIELEAQLRQYEAIPDFGKDVDGFEEETDQTEEVSERMAVRQALKDRLIEIEETLHKMEKAT